VRKWGKVATQTECEERVNTGRLPSRVPDTGTENRDTGREKYAACEAACASITAMHKPARILLPSFIALVFTVSVLAGCSTQPKTAPCEPSDVTKVHVVGVYEGELPGGGKRGFREHAQGEVTVNVGGNGRIVLVLTAYEPVKWKVVPQGVIVDQILLFGYYDQEVEAPSGARVYSNLQTSVGSSSMYAYKKDANYAALERAVREITGRDVDTFQGTYRAGSFYVNSGGLQSTTAED